MRIQKRIISRVFAVAFIMIGLTITNTFMVHAMAPTTYTIKFKNWNDTTLQTKYLSYGATPSYSAATPTKPPTDYKTYAFNGWTPKITKVTGPATYTATFLEEDRKYNINVSSNIVGAGTVSATPDSAVPSTNIILSATPTTGYSFINWSSNSGISINNPLSATNASFSLSTNNVDVTANFEALPSNTVTYEVVNGKWDDDTTTNKTEPVLDGGHLAHIPGVGNKPNGGYREGSWSSPAPDTSTSITSNKTYTYTYAPITVIFDPNGGSVDPTTATVGSDGKLTSLPTPQRENFSCDGWFDGENQVDENKVYTADTTLVAHWTETSTTYQLDVTKEGEGTVAPSSGQKTPGTTIDITATPATNYAFVRWEATGVTISNPTDATNSFSMPSNAVTVKAIFKPIPATPVISPGTGTYTSAKDVTITCGTTGATIKYYLGETKPVTPSTYSSAINISESTKLTAWSEKDGAKSSEASATYTISSSSTDHTITVTNDGHGTGTADPTSASNDALISLSTTPDGGYIFDRWTSEDGVTFANSKSADTTFRMLDKNVTVKANFMPETPTEKCTITFDKNGGSGTMNPQKVNKGTATKLNKNIFTRDGYEFKNWNTKSDGSGTSYADEDNITANTDLTLYAQWKKDEPKRESKSEKKSEEHSSKPAVINPDTVEGYFLVNGQILSGVAMGKTKQGPAAQIVLNANRPTGWLEAFTFNMAISGKVDYTLKNGVLTIIIPLEYQKAGRTFAIMALDKNGKAWTFADIDKNPSTVTANINVEGYAFALIYKD